MKSPLRATSIASWMELKSALPSSSTVHVVANAVPVRKNEMRAMRNINTPSIALNCTRARKISELVGETTYRAC